MPPGKQRPEHRSIVVLDLTGSGRWDNRTQLAARATLNKAVHAAFRAARVPRSQLVVEDRGDGMIVLVPATVSKAHLLHPVVPVLASAIGEHNAAVPEETRLHVRVSIHAGELVRDAYGWAGADLNLACRLVSCEPAHRHSPRTDVVVIVSELIHHGIVRHGYQDIDPAGYLPVRAANKEVDTRAWMHLPTAVQRPVPVAAAS